MSLFSNVSSRRWFSGRQRETGSPIALYRFTEWRTEALRNNSCTFDLCRVSLSARENATGTAYFLHGPKSTLIQFRGSVEGKYQRQSSFAVLTPPILSYNHQLFTARKQVWYFVWLTQEETPVFTRIFLFSLVI